MIKLQIKSVNEVFDTSRSLTDTAKKHAEKVPSLIDPHALSSCDSVPKLYSTEKETVIKHLKDQNLSLSSLGLNAKRVNGK